MQNPEDNANLSNLSVNQLAPKLPQRYKDANMYIWIPGYDELAAQKELELCAANCIREDRKVIDCAVSEELGRLALVILDYVLNQIKYKRYNGQVRAEMRSFAIYEGLKNLNRYNRLKVNSNSPAYCFIRLCVERPIWKYLNRTHRKDKDRAAIESPLQDECEGENVGLAVASSLLIEMDDNKIFAEYVAEIANKSNTMAIYSKRGL